MYNKIKCSGSEYKRIESEALTWDAKNKNQIRRRSLSNGISYRYIIDDDYGVHVIGRALSKNIHEWRQTYGDQGTERPDTTVKELRAEYGRYRNGISTTENGREQAENDRSDNSTIRQQGDSDRAGHPENWRYVDRGTEARIQESPVKVVQTFKDISGKTKSIIKIGSEYYIKDNHRAHPAKSIEQAVENENKRVILRNAKKYDMSASLEKYEGMAKALKKDVRAQKSKKVPQIEEKPQIKNCYPPDRGDSS